MTELEALGMVSDRLVGGIMFHSEHADLMHMLGLGWKAHEKGFIDDSKALRRVRRMSVRHLGAVPPQGRQERRDDRMEGVTRQNIGPQSTQRLIRASITEWRDWEEGTASTFNEASAHLTGNSCLWEMVRELQAGAERERCEAEELLREMESCSYDLAHAYDRMGNG